MNTQEVANKLVNMCRQGNFSGAMEELYADNIVSREMPGWPNEVTSGIKQVLKKVNDGWKMFRNFTKPKFQIP